MKSIIIFNLLAITIINPIVNSHENHNHQIYNWTNSKNRNIKTNRNLNVEKSEDKKNITTNNTKSIRIKDLKDKSNS